MKKLTVVFTVLLLGIMASVGSFAREKEDEEKEPKYTIKEVMKKAHKSGLYKKVARGDATEEEKKALLEMYIALAKHKPRKGSQKAWEAHTKVLVEAAQAALDDEEEAGEKITKAANCGACHTAHKGG